jgi:DNA excision repair protein ERCC-3
VVESGAAIVQSDKTVLIELAHPSAEEARHDIAVFADLERAPEHVHTYRITRLTLWNAEAAGHTGEEIIATLSAHSRFPVPDAVIADINDAMGRCGQVVLRRSDEGELLLGGEPAILREIEGSKKIAPLLAGHTPEGELVIEALSRGKLKQELLRIGWPATDLAGYVEGEHCDIALETTSWGLRDYQIAAVDRFVQQGSGVVCLPCGAGKTMVGAGVMATLDQATLILVTNTLAARQWRDELLARTSLTEDDIGEYSGSAKEVKPVTIATYSIVTAKRQGEFRHIGLLGAQRWGLVVYDEVHLLPAPVFQLSAELQATRRLGLTATLIREDGREGDVFSLIGPKRYDAAWKDLERQGYLAPAHCVEVRLELEPEQRIHYATLPDAERYRFASSSADKDDIVQTIVESHPDERILVMGMYLDQLERLATRLDVPLVTGETPMAEREKLISGFRRGEIGTLVVSKVANFSLDLPEASIAIQISGTFGSRQEEAQRLGRIVRPKADGRRAVFYSVVTRDTLDQDYAMNRQRFLTEQGYAYDIVRQEDLPHALSTHQ